MKNSAAAAVLLLLCLGHWALKWNSLPLPYLSDEGEYAYQAQVLNAGDVPYRDAYNQKPPLVFYFYRAAFALFGESEQSPRQLAMIFSWLTMILLWLMTPGEWPDGIRLAAPGLYGTLCTIPVGDMGFAANTESFLTLPLTIAAALLLKPRRLSWEILAAGLAAGAAIMTKQTALWTALCFGAWLAWRANSKERPRALALYDLGLFSLPVSLLALWFLKGGLSDFWEQTVIRNMDYASVMLASSAASAQLAWFAADVLPLLLRGSLPAVLLALYGLSATRLSGEEPLGILATLWLGASFVGAATGLYFFPHYFLPLMAPLSLLAALGLKRLHEKRRAWGSPWLLAGLCLYQPLAYYKSYSASPEDLARGILHPNPLYESRAAAGYIASRTLPSDTIYVFGSEPQMYVYARRKAATRHNFIFPLTLFPRDETDILQELKSLEAYPPRYIVYVNLSASTLIATAHGKRFQEGVLKLLQSRYRWDVWIPSKGAGAPLLDPSAKPGALPDWSREGLYLFALAGR